MLFQNDPFRDLESALSRTPGRPRSGGIPMDAYRRDHNVWVHFDLPGVAADSIEINLDRSLLTVSAQRGWETLESDQMYVSERPQGTFSRQVQLGEGLDASAIEADYRDGVLTLRIPVAEAAQPRKIPITRTDS